MDLKFYKVKILLHMTNHARRLSATTIVPSKNPEHIANAIIQYWVALYGSEALNIRQQTARAESPWSSGLVE